MIEEFSFDLVNPEMFNMDPFGIASLTTGFINLKFWDKIKHGITFLCCFINDL